MTRGGLRAAACHRSHVSRPRRRPLRERYVCGRSWRSRSNALLGLVVVPSAEGHYIVEWLPRGAEAERPVVQVMEFDFQGVPADEAPRVLVTHMPRAAHEPPARTPFVFA